MLTKAGWQRIFSLNLLKPRFKAAEQITQTETGHFEVQESARAQKIHLSDKYVEVIPCFHSTLRLKIKVEGTYTLNLLLSRFIDNREK